MEEIYFSLSSSSKIRTVFLVPYNDELITHKFTEFIVNVHNFFMLRILIIYYVTQCFSISFHSS